MSALDKAIAGMMAIDGSQGCAIVDYTSGMLLAS